MGRRSLYPSSFLLVLETEDMMDWTFVGGVIFGICLGVLFTVKYYKTKEIFEEMKK